MKYAIGLGFLGLVFLSACGRTSATPSDLANFGENIHQTVADISESLESSGTITASTRATACRLKTFDCTGGTATKDWDGCTGGFAAAFTMSGSTQVTLAKEDTSGTCVLSEAKTILRQPNFTLTGRRGNAELAVTSASVTAYDDTVTFGSGQQVTVNAAGDYTWKTLGINRKLTLNGTTLFDFSTKTTTDLAITGTSRSDRKIVSGVLKVYHNVARYTASVTFENLEYTDTCNEPIAGTVTGGFTGSITGLYSLTFNDCGKSSITFVEIGKPESVSADVTSDSSASSS